VKDGPGAKSSRAFLVVRKSTVATLCAVAASKFNLTDEPYDLIIRLSAQKPARRRCTYWPGSARHYRVAVMTRVAAGPECARRLPGKWIPIFQDRVNTDTTVLIIRVVFTL